MQPVVIVGAGPVGLVTALLLARWQVPTVVLETTPVRDVTGSRAICFQRDVLDILDRVGCADVMVARGVTWTTGRTFYREHELFTTTFSETGRGGYPPWINISQAEVETYLLDQVKGASVVDLRFGCRVVGVRSEASGVEVTADGPNGAMTVRGSYVVAADGGHSTVRECTRLAFPGRSFDDRFLICDIRADLPFPRERRFFFDPEWNPGRQVLVHEQPDRVWRIDWQVPADFDLAAERASGELDRRIRRIVGAVPYELCWASVYRFHERVAERFRIGRILLAGDAAHVFAPFGARGLNSGIQDAENLSWKLAVIWNGWVDEPAEEALLESYDLERRAAALENLQVTGETMEFLVPHGEEQWTWRRTVLERAVADPSARPLINSGKLAEPYWYLDSPLTTPASDTSGVPTEPGALRPPLPGLLCPDAPILALVEKGTLRQESWQKVPFSTSGRAVVSRLRKLFGSGFVVLVADRSRLADARGATAGVAVPVAVHSVPDLAADDALAAALSVGEDTVHVVRPDGHLAAVLSAYDGDALVAALRRATGGGRAG